MQRYDINPGSTFFRMSDFSVLKSDFWLADFQEGFSVYEKTGDSSESAPFVYFLTVCLPFHGLLQELSVGRILSCECLSFVLYANHNQRFRTIVAH